MYKMDLSLHSCQGCPTAISNRVENRNWLVLVLLTSTNRKIISVSNRPVSWCPMSQGAPVCPIYMYEWYNLTVKSRGDWGTLGLRAH